MSLGWKILAKVGLAETVEVSETATAAPSAGTAPTATPATAQHAAPVASPLPKPPVDEESARRLAELDKTLRERLIKAMENDGAPLVEEFEATIEPLIEAIPDERARCMAALKILAKKRTTVPALLSDFDKCLGVLEENSRMFDSDMQKQLESRVGGKQRMVEDLKGQIKTKNDQIAALQAEVANLAVKQQEAETGIGTEQEKITQVKERFSSMYNAVRGEIQGQRAKIAQYGQGMQ